MFLGKKRNSQEMFLFDLSSNLNLSISYTLPYVKMFPYNLSEVFTLRLENNSTQIFSKLLIVFI